MDHRFSGTNEPFELHSVSDSLVEALWETLVALTTAAAICISLISLSAQLNEVRNVRSAGAGASQTTATLNLPSGVTSASEETSHYN